MQNDDTREQEDTNHLLGWISVFGLIFLIFMITASAYILSAKNDGDTLLQPATPRQVYLNIISETHTGKRMARLADYITHTPFNTNTKLALVRLSALSAHEQTAWAKLTETTYKLQSSEAGKTKALERYKSQWGIWNRQQDLQALLKGGILLEQGTSQSQYAPEKLQSKFAHSADDTTLAGATNFSIGERNVLGKPQFYGTETNHDVRVKYAKRPRYPRKAQRRGVEAVVTLALDIDERGNVARTHVVGVNVKNGSTARYDAKFVSAARRAARRSKFYPKTIQNRPVARSKYIRQYTFTAGG